MPPHTLTRSEPLGSVSISPRVRLRAQDLAATAVRTNGPAPRWEPTPGLEPGTYALQEPCPARAMASTCDCSCTSISVVRPEPPWATVLRSTFGSTIRCLDVLDALECR